MSWFRKNKPSPVTIDEREQIYQEAYDCALKVLMKTFHDEIMATVKECAKDAGDKIKTEVIVTKESLYAYDWDDDLRKCIGCKNTLRLPSISFTVHMKPSEVYLQGYVGASEVSGSSETYVSRDGW